MKPTALERFVAKCCFRWQTGCVEWTGATSANRAGTQRTGVFRYERRTWKARRWAAVFIHGLELQEGQEVNVRCGNPLCVRHVEVVWPAGNTRQHWLLVTYGYGGDEPEDERIAREAKERAALEAALTPADRTWPVWLPVPEPDDA